MEKILIGIDGGGSNTKLIVSDFDLKIIEKSTGGASNFLKIGFKNAVLNVVNLVEPFLPTFKDSMITLVIGTAGAGREDNANEFEKYLAESLTNIAKIKVVSDAAITLKGAFEEDDGAILIVGTGSILYYKIGNEIKRIGGYGRLIGDEGSGYSLGKRGLNLVSKMLDKRLNKSLLLELAIENLKVDSPNQLISKIYNDNFEIASFAKVVIDAANNGDALAQALIENETNELILHLESMISLNNIDNIKLVLSGGLVASDNLYRQCLIDNISRKLPQIKTVEAKYSPEFGAVLMAKDLCLGNE